jgi:hypothetical protein
MPHELAMCLSIMSKKSSSLLGSMSAQEGEGEPGASEVTEGQAVDPATEAVLLAVRGFHERGAEHDLLELSGGTTSSFSKSKKVLRTTRVGTASVMLTSKMIWNMKTTGVKLS